MPKVTYADKVDSLLNPLPARNKVLARDMNEIKNSINTLYDSFPAGIEEYIIVDTLEDLPDPIEGVINLNASTAYFFVNELDLVGNRMVGSSNTTLLGTSSETSIITSTGLGVGVPLFSTSFTTPIRHIAFKDVDTAISITEAGNSAAYDWLGVNFVNVPNIGTLGGGGNFILLNCAILNSKGLIFTGTWGTIGIDSCLFSGDGAVGTLITINPSCVVTRRFRVIYSAIVAFGSTVGIDVDALATLPIEGFILDTISFSGGSTYLGGIVGSNGNSLFSNCTGVVNSYEISNYYMNGNSTVTVIGSVGVAVKIAGTTLSNPLTQKFINTDNRATYVGGVTRLFNATAVASVTSTSRNDQIGFYLTKNGVLITESKIYVTTDTNNRAENVVIQALSSLAPNDYIEVWAENSSDSSNVTITELNVLVKSLA